MPRPANVVELLQDLVAIPSVNPQGDPGTDRVGEQAVAEYVAEFLCDCGGQVTMDEVKPGRPNVTAQFVPAGSPKARLAFAPHLDTVSVAGMSISPFEPEVRDGKLWGRGSSDTKGPMAAALWALREWAQSGARSKSHVHWTFFGLMGEEADNEGAHAVADSGFASDLVLVLEPTSLQVVSAHKGVMWIEISTAGVACHGSTPDQGKSAIYAMARVLEVIEQKIAPDWAKRRHAKLGPATLNVGTISGGSKINIVPDHCRIEVDCRLIPGMDAETVRRQLETDLRAVVPEVQVNLQRHAAPLDTGETLPWVSKLGAQSRGFTTAPWFSDASVLSSPRCPAVCVGPGSIAQAHTRDEFIAVSDLEEGVDFFRRWIATAEA